MPRMVPLYQKPCIKMPSTVILIGPGCLKSARNPAYWSAPTSVVVTIVSANSRPCSHTRSWNFRRGCQTTGVGSKLADVLEVFARLEADGATRRDAHFLAGAGVTADAALARLHLEDSESAKFDPFAALHGGPHRVEHRVHRNLGLDLGDVRDLRHFVDDVDLDHA